jgi:hypothetical protein
MLSCDGCQPRPSVFWIDRHEIQLQGKVIGNIGPMAEDVAPWASFNADALMVFMALGRHFVRSNPRTEIRRVIYPLMARRPTGSPLDDVSSEQMRSDGHQSP